MKKFDDNIRGDFNLDGTYKRTRRKPCRQCGAMRHCDICWEHVEDYSPFHVWHCLLCHMPTFVYNVDHSEALRPIRCDFCGWDERTETLLSGLDEQGEPYTRDRDQDGESRGPPK